MPSVSISTKQLQTLFHSETKQTTVTTPLGNTIVEIQGDLEVPLSRPSDDSASDEILSRFTQYKGEDIVRFGLLTISPDNKVATLYVGKKQRLLGNVVKLETPLGLLKFDNDSGTVEMQDIFEYKIIFKERPLPIM
ncbi:hypothetical protein Kpol_1028p78 [Vanderwaltozyma polyspora DSM 70294]|uniref:Chromosome transmission fidelity protein 8 n=1 Tax=Vanderwaltozyma polyspora (strain ATCC 22028 / DSM 70294 / BCRC 21397 / CBS 2163 / NBRC 10782 / NRRL Y-8283 / UCD 57-17) TaxID=436907 RepID=A7TG45_VANPO|nr:uncharacterized protein Kpol_1028p78 [Vanderwaltozyma polyspora DSM 70294]EDO18802.1 hypothetical protein Kpol_1028p78 [Vanderwaltozyma polyspora DSM 70294]